MKKDNDGRDPSNSEEGTRSAGESANEVGGKSYADAVLQHTDRDRSPRKLKTSLTVSENGVQTSHGNPDAKGLTYMKVKHGREHYLKIQKKKNEKVVTSILKREIPVGFKVCPVRANSVSMAQEFALSDSCTSLMDEMGCNHYRMPYTKQLNENSLENY